MDRFTLKKKVLWSFETAAAIYQPTRCNVPLTYESSISVQIIYKYIYSIYIHKGKGKGKAVPINAWSGPEGSRKLRFQDFMTTA